MSADRSAPSTAPSVNGPPLEEPSTIVVVLSEDDLLVRTLPDSLIRDEPDAEIHMLRALPDLQHHLTKLQPDVVVLDAAVVDPKSLGEILREGPVSRSAQVVLGRVGEVEGAKDLALEAGTAAYVSRDSDYPQEVLDAVRDARRSSPSRVAEAEQHYKNILEASTDGIFVLAKGAFIYLNTALAELLGRSTIDVVGRSLVDFVSSAECSMVEELISRVEVTGEKDLIETTLVTTTTPRRVQISCSSSVFHGHRAVVGVARDMTEVRAMEREIENTRQRAAQIERLRALGELAAGVAHDFNNVLSTMLGRIMLAQEKLVDARPVHDDLQVMEQAARDAMRIVQRIHDFSRPAQTDSWEDIDLTRLVHDVANFVHTDMPSQVAFKVDARTTPSIRGNATELREVFLNLLRNAVDAVGGEGEVAVQCYEDGGRAVVVVQDTGHGMSPEVQQKIFEPFFTTKSEQGTGLGLSVSHWILRRHDAQIELKSEPGQGTRFRLLFSPIQGIHTTRKLTAKEELIILVVDDDHTVAEMVAEILGDDGHQVTIVTSAQQALSTVEKTDFDLVITDLDLPDMGGWQLAREIRAHCEDLLVGLMTGWPLDIDDSELKERGADFTLSKPFTPATLQEALDALRE